jgi:hypothetical protein
MKRADFDAEHLAIKLRKHAATCDRQIIWLEWLLQSKLGARHRASVEKELDEQRKTLVALRARLNGRGGNYPLE